MNDKKLRYKLDTAEIVAFIFALFIIIEMNKYVLQFVKKPTNIILVFIIILSCFSALFGPYVGGITGFLGVICGYSFNGIDVPFGEAFAMLVFGVIVGHFAYVYKVRDGGFGKKQIAIFMLIECIASTVSLVFIKPFIEYMFYDVELFDALWDGMVKSAVVSLPINFVLAIFLFLVNAFHNSTKS